MKQGGAHHRALAPAMLGQGGLPDGFRVVRTPQSAGMMRRESRARALCLAAGLTPDASNTHHQPLHGHNPN